MNVHIKGLSTIISSSQLHHAVQSFVATAFKNCIITWRIAEDQQSTLSSMPNFTDQDLPKAMPSNISLSSYLRRPCSMLASLIILTSCFIAYWRSTALMRNSVLASTPSRHSLHVDSRTHSNTNLTACVLEAHPQRSHGTSNKGIQYVEIASIWADIQTLSFLAGICSLIEGRDRIKINSWMDLKIEAWMRP